MKVTFLALCVGAVVATGAVSPVLAQRMNADDVKWINQCISDNKGQPGATDAIVRKYCMCMNEKMDNNESQSISTWEKSHPTERAACDKESGWK
jgi:hypothetical protein